METISEKINVSIDKEIFKWVYLMESDIFEDFLNEKSAIYNGSIIRLDLLR